MGQDQVESKRKYAYMAAPALVALGAALGFGVAPDPITFENISERSGIDFVLRNGATPEKRQIETMAGGVALFDYDGDGLLDVFFTNGATQPGLLKDSPAWWNRLYRNRGQGVFEDVTARAGVRGEGFSMGAAVAAPSKTSRLRPAFTPNPGPSPRVGSTMTATGCSTSSW